MARDVRDFSVPIRVDFYSPPETLVTSRSSSQQSVRSFRSEPIPTLPFPGTSIYHDPTGYSAFFSTVSYQADEVRWGGDPSRNIEENRMRWDGPDMPPSIWRMGCSSTLRPNPPNRMVSAVRTRMDSQIREDLNLSQFAGEARETAQLLVAILRAVVNLIRAFRGKFKGTDWKQVADEAAREWKRVRRGTPGAIRTQVADGKGGYKYVYVTRRNPQAMGKRLGTSTKAAQAYLTLIYGLMPLASDVKKICDHWDDRTKAPIAKKLFASVEEEIPKPALAGLRDVSGKRMWGVKSGAVTVVTDPQLLRASQYGLTSPLSLAWELLTLSFVIDWFTGIGSFIQGLERPMGVTVQDLYETQWVDANFDYTFDRFRTQEGVNAVANGPIPLARARVRVKAMQRLKSPQLLRPPIFFKTGVSSSQAWSLIALLHARS